MSSGMFDGLEGIFSPDQEESYVSGEQGCPPALLDAVLESHIAYPGNWRAFGEHPEEYLERTEAYREMFKSTLPEGFDHNDFLGALLLRFCQAVHPEHNASNGVDVLFSPLIQALYEQGYNNFRLESPSPDFVMRHLACHLKGEPGRPLVFKYAGDIDGYFGYGAEHCKLILDGHTFDAGRCAQSSRFVCNSVGTWYALDSRGCSFVLPSDHEGVWIPIDTVHDAEFYFAVRKPYYSYRGDSGRTFFSNNNRAFYLTKDNTWWEVRP